MLGHAVAQLDFFGIGRRRAQHGRDVVGDLVAGDRQHRGVTDRAAGEDGDVGGAAADIDQHDAQLFFVGGQHGQAGSQGLQDQILHFQAAAAHALDDVLCGADRAGHDVHAHFQAQAAHADGLADVFLAVNDEFLRQHVQHLLIGGDVHGLGGLDDASDIGGGDFLVFHGDHAAGVEAADMAAGDAGVDVADLAICHQLGFFKRSLDGIHSGLDIDDHALAHAARFVLAQAKHFESPFGQDFSHHSHHLAGADIEGDDKVLDVTGHGVSVSWEVSVWIWIWFPTRATGPAPGRNHWDSADRPA